MSECNSSVPGNTAPIDDAWGDHAAERRNRIFSQLYDDLKRIAHSEMTSQQQEHLLQSTALVHEAYLRLSKDAEASFANRDHFLAVVVRAMRSVLVDHARDRGRKKRTPNGDKVSLDALDSMVMSMDAIGVNLEELNNALTKLRSLEPRLVELVELRFIAGLEMKHIAELLGTPLRSLERDWQFAKSWLRRELTR